MAREDLERPDARRVVEELNALVGDLSRHGLRASSWFGELEATPELEQWELANRGYDYEPLPGAADDDRFPWFLYWEIAWLAINNRFRPGDRLLDLGGSSSLFSCYLASRGLDVVTVDLDRRLVSHGDEIAAATGWTLRNLCMDMASLELEETFDHVTSVCVYEHIPVSGRASVSGRVRELLRPGGSFSVTFDYLNPSRLARISSPEALRRQIVEPSGLRVRGNRDFVDTGQRYLLHPCHHGAAPQHGWQELMVASGQLDARQAAETRGENEYTFGALFLQRPPT
jgi:2-polyprenyl-3-methyl-5-hydroxy-6-metoxy-1,4-benzoquinol methylase